MSNPVVWVRTDTGEMVEGECPYCEATREEAETQIKRMEAERRTDRAARAKAEREVERQKAAKRDAAAWAEVLAFYAEHFPDKAAAMRSKSIKSERASVFFHRLESIDSEDPMRDIKAAIFAATRWRWISYGRRVKKPHAEAQPAVDLADILKDDVRFDYLVKHGYEMREAAKAQE